MEHGAVRSARPRHHLVDRVPCRVEWGCWNIATLRHTEAGGSTLATLGVKGSFGLLEGNNWY